MPHFSNLYSALGTKMKSKPGRGKLQPLVDLREEQGYLTFDQINDLLPPEVVSPGDLSTAVKSFEALDLKILNEVPDQNARENVEPEPAHEQEEEERRASANEPSDPLRIYLKEMAQFKLLTREGELEVAKRIEAGRADVVKEVLNSPIMLEHIIRIGELLETGEADLSIVLENDVNEADAEAGAQDQAPRERLLKVVGNSPHCAKNSSREKRRCARALARVTRPSSKCDSSN